jgi:hypothetical protein
MWIILPSVVDPVEARRPDPDRVNRLPVGGVQNVGITESSGRWAQLASLIAVASAVERRLLFRPDRWVGVVAPLHIRIDRPVSRCQWVGSVLLVRRL